MIPKGHKDLIDIFNNPTNRTRVFNWHKAVDLIKAHGIRNAAAGLAEDWTYTHGIILHEGEPVTPEFDIMYLSSRWATPALEDLDGDGLLHECWMMEEDTEWDAHTRWPESAKEMLAQESL